eukprot:TRINITY_DN2498_c0_g4_i3.p1 TRINITY_DN2498_c0_g4~~TRINITY_DN2498_c0_g4_i3.p1  ORF type:complete len:373 (+),score=86.68 TRINITY_DN2498_c0_g4_i3:73-1191(+)
MWVKVICFATSAVALTSAGSHPPPVRFTTQGGGEVPALAFGTSGVKNEEAVLAALKAGYRHIDTALIYGSHRAVGEALRQSGLRSDVFLTTKVSFLPGLSAPWRWLFDTLYGQGAGFASLAGKGGERAAIQQSLAELNVSQVDLCLLHAPLATGMPEFLAAYLPHRLGRMKPVTWQKLSVLRPEAKIWLRKVASVFGSGAAGAALRRRAWRALEAAHAAGECKYIGVSNWDVTLLKELESSAQVLPAVNQIEFHARYQAKETLAYCRKKGIAVMAYGHGLTMDHEVAQQIAERRGMSSAQVAIQWSLKKGVAPIVRSSRREGMTENLEAMETKLTHDDLIELDAIDEGEPFYWDVSAVQTDEVSTEGRSAEL